MVGKNWIAIAVTATVFYAVPFARGEQAYVYSDPYNFDCAMACNDCAEPLCEAISDCCEPDPWLASSVELLWLNRTKAEHQPLIGVERGGTTYSAMDVRDLMFGVKSGIRLRAVYGSPSGQTLEMAYAGIYDQFAAESRTYTPSQVDSMEYHFFGTFPTGAFSYTARYDTDLHSVELNWGLGEWNRFRPFLGARWIRLEDKLRVYESAAYDNRSMARMENDLVGGQMGFHLGLWDRGKWFRVEATAKSGAFHNYVDLYARQQTTAGPVDAFKRRFETTSVAGEINVTAIAQVTDGLAFTFGYTGLWLADIGLAPDQSNNFDLATGQGDLDVNGVSYQGGRFGIEWVY